MRFPALLLAVLAGTAATRAAPLTYVATRDVVIDFQVAKPADVTAVDLWVSDDNGRTWHPADAARAGPQSVQFKAPCDGKFLFHIILRNDTGASAQPPQPGTPPLATVVVDTVPPLLQVHRVRADEDNAESALLIETSLVEENLSESSVRVFYRTAGNAWTDGGPAARFESTLSWKPPLIDAASVDLRIVVTDRAGNCASSDVSDVALPPAARREGKSTGRESGAASDRKKPSGPATSEPVQQAVHAELESGKPSAATPPLPPDGSATRGSDELRRLREMAARFHGDGHPALAAARLADALTLAPNDVDLMVELGQALYRTGKYDDADRRFRAALEQAPENASAVEGLALVAATQRRYSDARDHLQHLLRLRPDSGANWLRCGDIEHRLGNEEQARAAWEKALAAPTADADLREKAKRRLDYFRSP